MPGLAKLNQAAARLGWIPSLLDLERCSVQVQTGWEFEVRENLSVTEKGAYQFRTVKPTKSQSTVPLQDALRFLRAWTPLRATLWHNDGSLYVNRPLSRPRGRSWSSLIQSLEARKKGWRLKCKGFRWEGKKGNWRWVARLSWMEGEGFEVTFHAALAGPRAGRLAVLRKAASSLRRIGLQPMPHATLWNRGPAGILYLARSRVSFAAAIALARRVTSWRPPGVDLP